MGRLSIVAHAVERYRERWAPHLSVREARNELELIAEGARPQKSKTYSGQELWVADTADKILFVVKRDRGDRICVTVLPQGAGDPIDNSQCILSEYLEYQEEREADAERIRQTLQEEDDRRLLELSRQAKALKDKNKTVLATGGRLCDVCQDEEAARYATKFQQKWCSTCHEKINKDGRRIGACPSFQDWEQNLRDKVKVDRSPAHAANLFRSVYDTALWFVKVLPLDETLQVIARKDPPPLDQVLFDRGFMGYRVVVTLQ